MAEPSASRTDELILGSILKALDRSVVQPSPFAHFSVDQVFPPEIYRGLVARLPPPGAYVADPGKYRQADGAPSRYRFPLSDQSLAGLTAEDRMLWTAVRDALSSRLLRDKVFDMLATALGRRFWRTRTGLRRILAVPRPCLVRDLGGYQIDPHPDSRSKIVTMQFYLPEGPSQADMGTSIYRLRPRNLPRLLLARSPLEKCGQFAFKPNSGYGFAVGWRSWHGRERIPEASGIRNSLLLFYYRAAEDGWHGGADAF